MPSPLSRQNGSACPRLLRTCPGSCCRFWARHWSRCSGRFIGSPYLRRHGAAAANAHLSAVGLGAITVGLPWLSDIAPDSDGVPGMGGGLVAALGFAAALVFIAVILVRGVEAVAGAAAALRGDLRPYVLSVHLIS